MNKPPSILILLVLICSAHSAIGAELEPMKLTILDVSPTTVNVGDYVRIDTQLTYANGSEVTVEFMEMVQNHIYVNGHEGTGVNLFNHTGYSHVPYLKMTSSGNVQIKCAVEDNLDKQWKGIESEVFWINVVDPTKQDSATGLVKYISYAKGFFALSFFCALFFTIGIGCISAASNDPQKKSESEQTMFALTKILCTVTVLFLLSLYLAP